MISEQNDHRDYIAVKYFVMWEIITYSHAPKTIFSTTSTEYIVVFTRPSGISVWCGVVWSLVFLKHRVLVIAAPATPNHISPPNRSAPPIVDPLVALNRSAFPVCRGREGTSPGRVLAPRPGVLCGRDGLRLLSRLAWLCGLTEQKRLYQSQSGSVSCGCSSDGQERECVCFV